MNPLPESELRRIMEQHPYPLLFATLSGAHLYGFPSPDSDYDLRGVHVLPAQIVLGLAPVDETLESSQVQDGLEIDLVTHDVLKFFKLLLKRNGYVLEQLTSPIVLHSTPEFLELRELVPRLVTRHHAHHYLGFAQNEWKLLQKRPRLKTLLYLYRVLLTGIHLMRTGEIEANLLSLAPEYGYENLLELAKLKMTGVENQETELDLALHEAHYDSLCQRLEHEHRDSALPDSPTAHEELNSLLVRVRLQSLA